MEAFHGCQAYEGFESIVPFDNAMKEEFVAVAIKGGYGAFPDAVVGIVERTMWLFRDCP